ncbi:MAG: hypothetical protein CMR00_04545 [[Chlorobium] sp. 445]|nr:MAG: hypothetical protein CMR00_04545 [[Chlorobium] sp. 445]
MRLCAFLLITHFSALQSISVGDEAFAKIDYPSTITIYEAALEKSPNDAELLWRLARVYVCQGDVVAFSEKESFYRKAEHYARRAIKADPNKGEAYTWLAAALGNLALYYGGSAKVQLVVEIQRALNKAIALNEKDDVAYSILGSFYRSLANVGWFERQVANVFLGGLPEGGFAEAEKALKKAIELSPNTMRHHYELGLLYMDTRQLKEARKAFENAQRCPVLIASDRQRLTQIKKILAYIDEQLHE